MPKKPKSPLDAPTLPPELKEAQKLTPQAGMEEGNFDKDKAYSGADAPSLFFNSAELDTLQGQVEEKVMVLVNPGEEFEPAEVAILPEDEVARGRRVVSVEAQDLNEQEFTDEHIVQQGEATAAKIRTASKLAAPKVDDGAKTLHWGAGGQAFIRGVEPKQLVPVEIGDLAEVAQALKERRTLPPHLTFKNEDGEPSVEVNALIDALLAAPPKTDEEAIPYLATLYTMMSKDRIPKNVFFGTLNALSKKLNLNTERIEASDQGETVIKANPMFMEQIIRDLGRESVTPLFQGLEGRDLAIISLHARYCKVQPNTAMVYPNRAVPYVYIEQGPGTGGQIEANGMSKSQGTGEALNLAGALTEITLDKIKALNGGAYIRIDLQAAFPHLSSAARTVLLQRASVPLSKELGRLHRLPNTMKSPAKDNTVDGSHEFDMRTLNHLLYGMESSDFITEKGVEIKREPGKMILFIGEIEETNHHGELIESLNSGGVNGLAGEAFALSSENDFSHFILKSGKALLVSNRIEGRPSRSDESLTGSERQQSELFQALFDRLVAKVKRERARLNH